VKPGGQGPEHVLGKVELAISRHQLGKVGLATVLGLFGCELLTGCRKYVACRPPCDPLDVDRGTKAAQFACHCKIPGHMSEPERAANVQNSALHGFRSRHMSAPPSLAESLRESESTADGANSMLAVL